MKRRNFFKAALASIAAMASGAVKAPSPSAVDPDLKSRLDELVKREVAKTQATRDAHARRIAEQEVMYNEIFRRYCPESQRKILRGVTLAITDDPK